MAIERKHVNNRMSQVVAHSGLVYLAGQVAQNASGGSVADQTRDILTRIDQLLAEAGTDKSKLLTASVWLADISKFDEMNSVWDGWVAKDNPPVRACVESRLADPAFTVEIMVTAAR